MSEITTQEIRSTMKTGFVSALAASNLSDAEIQKRAAAYDAQLDKREAHATSIRSAILEGAK